MLVVDEEKLPQWIGSDPVMTAYMRDEWGKPLHGETPVFERLCLEVFQSGLSWLTILKKRESFRRAFSGFDVDTVAAFGESEIETLLQDSSIVRNRRKIDAAIVNARATVALRESEGLSGLVWSYATSSHVELDDDGRLPAFSDASTTLAKVLKAKNFSFVGPTNMYALMCAIGVVDVRKALGLDK